MTGPGVPPAQSPPERVEHRGFMLALRGLTARKHVCIALETSLCWYVCTKVRDRRIVGRAPCRGKRVPNLSDAGGTTLGEMPPRAGYRGFAAVKVRFWGTRGSIAVPGPRTARFGGNTACVEVTTSSGVTLLLDCGTGARELGLALAQDARPAPANQRIHILVGHTHWDHIQGLPFFFPSLLGKFAVSLYGPAGFERSLAEAIAGQMQYAYFPVRLTDLSSAIEFHELEEGSFTIEDVWIQTQYLNHTAPTLGYRLIADGAVMVYSADHEPFWDPTDAGRKHPGDLRHVDFLSGADLIVHDAQYTAAEYPTKQGWGHSPVEYAIAVARQAGARRVALFHHDPLHDDEFIDRIVAGCDRPAGRLEVFAAAEGQEITLIEQASAPDQAVRFSALDQRVLAGDRVLIATLDLDETHGITETLAEEGLKISSVQDGDGALALARAVRPDLIVLDAGLRTSGGRLVARALRSGRRTATTPLLLLVSRQVAAAGAPGDAPGLSGELPLDDATDWMARPFSPAMLRSRVRARLGRLAAIADAASAGDRKPAHRARARGAVARLVERADFLATVPLFESLSPHERWQLAGRFAEREFHTGTEILVEGDAGDAFYIIRSALVRVAGGASSQRSIETRLDELGPGEIFGELSLLDDQRRSATVVAVRRTRCLVLSRADFLDLLQRSSAFALALLRVEAERLRQTDRQLVFEAPDALTGLPGRRALDATYKRLAAGVRRRGTGLGLLVIDLDHLKPINDNYGHLAGDQAIRVLSGVLVKSVRAADLVARWGGDEFVILLPDSTPAGTRATAARVRQLLSARIPDATLPVDVQVTVGTVWTDQPPDQLNGLFEEADQALRTAKKRRPRPRWLAAVPTDDDQRIAAVSD